MAIDLSTLTIKKAHAHLLAKDFSAVDLAQAYLKNIESKNKELNAYLEVFDDVIEQAKAADKRFEDKTAELLTGIPFAVKDNILIDGKIASSSSKMLANYRATYDATAIARLKAKGAVFLGRTNMDEFAMGGSTENSAFGVTKNPHDSTRVAGGSSGGSAAAVAMDAALVSLGSDTGGSVRQPSSFCGIVGLKPTYGAVSRHGVMAMGSSLDQIGPMAKSVEDVEIVFDAIRGLDPMDSTTISENTYSPKKVGASKPIIGIPRNFLGGDGIDKDVLLNFNHTLSKLQKQGFEVRDIALPNIGHSLSVYYVIMPAEVSANLARFDGVKYGLHVDGANLLEDYLLTRREGFGKEVRRRILLGTYVLSSGYYDAYYNKANAVRRVIVEDFNKAFESVDIVMTPTTPSPAFKIGEKTSDPLAMYLEDIFTVTANLTGMPAITIPSGMSLLQGKELPLGVQLTARHGAESTLFEVAKEMENQKS